jgi:hypothetical protein
MASAGPSSGWLAGAWSRLLGLINIIFNLKEYAFLPATFVGITKNLLTKSLSNPTFATDCTCGCGEEMQSVGDCYSQWVSAGFEPFQ